MNLYYTGIGIARNLDGLGMDVFGLSAEPDAPGMRSRFFRHVYAVPSSRDEPRALYERLMQIRQEHALAPVVFPTRDADVLFLHDHTDPLTGLYCLPPSREAASLLMDKLRLAALAQECDIAVPKTALCSSEVELERAAAVFAFPLVIKPRMAEEWRRRGAWEEVGARKAILVDTLAQLRDEYRKVAAVSREVLLQEYVAGEDSDIVVCCCCIGRDGRWLGHFTGKKLRQNPPLFGTGCLVEATPVPEIIEPSRSLLEACRYSGLAEVEFKRDRASGRFVLIEINPRHWDQHELGRLVGVNLTRIAYEDWIGLLPEPCLPDVGTRRPRWIAEREALFLIARNTARKLAGEGARGGSIGSRARILKAALAEVFDIFFRKPRLFSILNSRDPVPSVIFCSRLFLETIRLAARTLQRHT
jgi:predicted ATP-grasp superfamily ATP-dependent carboligase